MLVCGPKNSRYTYTGTRCPHTDLAIEVNAETVREAVAAYEAMFACKVTAAPDDLPVLRGHEGLYCIHIDVASGESVLVAVHVVRGDETIEVRQNFDIAVRPDDILDIVQLVGGSYTPIS